MKKIKLNKQQQEAVEHESGPLMIIAGAGTGKTTVITERIKYLLSNELAKTSEILALTFTEKAAQEMEERVDRAMPLGYGQMWISTFHSFCDRILRQDFPDLIHRLVEVDLHHRAAERGFIDLRQILGRIVLQFLQEYAVPGDFPHRLAVGRA